MNLSIMVFKVVANNCWGARMAWAMLKVTLPHMLKNMTHCFTGSVTLLVPM